MYYRTPKYGKWRKKNNYTILTRGKDFYDRALQTTIIPKIVLFRLGNCRSKEL
jgi:predicted nuclease of predicted toxin-antitoxin system